MKHGVVKYDQHA